LVLCAALFAVTSDTMAVSTKSANVARFRSGLKIPMIELTSKSTNPIQALGIMPGPPSRLAAWQRGKPYSVPTVGVDDAAADECGDDGQQQNRCSEHPHCDVEPRGEAKKGLSLPLSYLGVVDRCS
jgi:hypothetical protein